MNLPHSAWHLPLTVRRWLMLENESFLFCSRWFFPAPYLFFFNTCLTWREAGKQCQREGIQSAVLLRADVSDMAVLWCALCPLRDAPSSVQNARVGVSLCCDGSERSHVLNLSPFFTVSTAVYSATAHVWGTCFLSPLVRDPASHSSVKESSSSLIR